MNCPKCHFSICTCNNCRECGSNPCMCCSRCKKSFVNVVETVTNIHAIAAENAVEIDSIVYAI